MALPNMIPGTPGTALLEWAVRAEERGFSSLAATDRLVYPGYDPVSALAAAAGRTSRIGLLSNVLIAPLRAPVELAKQAAGLDQLSGGRFTLGLAPGVRADDFDAADRDFTDRVARFDRDIAALRELWAAGTVGPRPVRGHVPVLVGGVTAAAAERAARWADGWTAPGLTPDRTSELADRVRKAWSRAGRPGRPRIVMLLRFALGADVAEAADAFVRDYFAVLGPAAEDFVRDTPRDAASIRAALRAFADCGVDEVVFHPTVGDPAQVDRLADVTL
ncbi:LLM class flavin-dependent oxidoreductase [Saccharopolyspora rosea]|uniref:LLM class flavin-dependent oxidoreductase n=1 Tax=Saccharopolyspora rosea TaxID=524884 RepID=A0ABW3G0Z5_9PSEU